MTDRELLLELCKDIREMKHDMQVMKSDIHELKEDVRDLKENVKELKEDVRVLKEDVQVLKGEVQVLKGEVQVLKGEVQVLKEDVQILKEGMASTNQKLTVLSLKLENETNRNIQILAENHLDIIDKMNAAIRVQDKSVLYEVQISGLRARIDCLERDMETLKHQAS